MRRRIRLCHTALICALFLCVELIVVSAMPQAVSSAVSIGAASVDSSESAKLHGESGPYWIEINIPAFRLTLFSGESPVKEYPIAVGKSASPSRIGTCKVVSKAKYPTWYPPDGRPPVPPGPDNPISCRWLGLSWAGYGIHGTNNPASIGKAVTLGCIRMHDKDVMELFDIVPVGTKVEFTYETVEVSSYGDGPMAIRLTVYRDLYQRGTNTIERVMESLRTSLAQVVPGAEPNMKSDTISPLMPDIDRPALAALVGAARGKPEPVPWRVRVELGVAATSMHAYPSGAGQKPADSADMMIYPSGVASDAQGGAFAWGVYPGEDSSHDIIGDSHSTDNHGLDNSVHAARSDAFAGVGDACPAATGACAAAADASAGASSSYAATSDTPAEAGLAYATIRDLYGEACAACMHASDACAAKDYEKAIDARIPPGVSRSAGDEACVSAGDGIDGVMNTLSGDGRADADRAKARDSVRVEMDLAHIEGDQVLVALRPVAEAFGYKVGWDAGSQAATVHQKTAKGVLRGGRLYVTPDELRRLLEEVVITWDPQTLTLRIIPISPATQLRVDR